MLFIKSKKFHAVNILFIFIFLTLFSSCSIDKGALNSDKPFNFTMPENASLTVSDIRVKGFTLSWINLDGDCEYAIAASHTGQIDDYKTALENGKIALDFTSGDILNGTYKVTKMIAGKDYEIKLFARKKNTMPAEYLTAKAALPYLDEAAITKLYIDGSEAIFDSVNDTYSHAQMYVPGIGEVNEYTVTYKLERLSELYLDNGKTKIENGEFKIKGGESILVTAINSKTGAARDYIVEIKAIDNGIPLVIINTENNRPVTSKNRYLQAEIKIIDSSVNPVAEYANGLFSGPIEIKGRGNSSLGMPKKSYNIETADKVMFLDMAKSRDWMLLANYSDKSLMRNYIAYELYRDMGAFFSPKLRFVDLIFNDEYVGTYCLGERVKIDKGRLELPKIKGIETVEETPNGTYVTPPTSGSDLSGSYVIEVNSTDKYSKDEIIFETKRINWNTEHFFSIKQPGEKNMTDEAYDYISNYINETEDALFSDNFTDPSNGYRKYMEVSTIIDWYIVNELFKNVDANFHTSVYMYKPRGGKLCMGPVWDFDLGAGNADYSGCDDYEGWYVRYCTWLERLFEDPAFVNELKDRWNYVKEHYFDMTFNRIDETAELIYKSQTMNFNVWKILGVYVWPNAGDVRSRDTYDKEIDYLKEWLTARIAWMDKEINA